MITHLPVMIIHLLTIIIHLPTIMIHLLTIIIHFPTIIILLPVNNSFTCCDNLSGTTFYLPIIILTLNRYVSMLQSCCERRYLKASSGLPFKETSPQREFLLFDMFVLNIYQYRVLKNCKTI
jgi:hypothetical protein